MSVTYTTDWLALLRGLLSVTFLHPRSFWLLLIPLLPLLFLLWLGLNLVSIIMVLGGWLGYFVAIFALAIILSMGMQLRKPCTTSIFAEGLRDTSGSRQTVVKWERIIKIAQVGSDIILYRGVSAGTFLPLSAFADPREAQRFYETAVDYWQNAKTGQPFTPTDETEVWPPAPAVGNSAEPGDSPSC